MNYKLTIFILLLLLSQWSCSVDKPAFVSVGYMNISVDVSGMVCQGELGFSRVVRVVLTDSDQTELYPVPTNDEIILGKNIVAPEAVAQICEALKNQTNFSEGVDLKRAFRLESLQVIVEFEDGKAGYLLCRLRDGNFYISPMFDGEPYGTVNNNLGNVIAALRSR